MSCSALHLWFDQFEQLSHCRFDGKLHWEDGVVEKFGFGSNLSSSQVRSTLRSSGASSILDGSNIVNMVVAKLPVALARRRLGSSGWHDSGITTPRLLRQGEGTHPWMPGNPKGMAARVQVKLKT